MEKVEILSTVLGDPWRIVGGVVIAIAVRSVVSNLTRPKNLPPFYSERPYLPFFGSLVQFALGPREFLQRAAAAKGDVFTIQVGNRRSRNM